MQRFIHDDTERDELERAYRVRLRNCRTAQDWFALEVDFAGWFDTRRPALKKPPQSVRFTEWVQQPKEKV